MNELKEDKRVLALKYRPKRFEDLIGQDVISQTLSLALDMSRFSHAYLFSGLRGSGKTSTARIMAKAFLCDSGPTSKPCETCLNCMSANANKHLDIIEMDAASNRGIDDIKSLIEQTKYNPSSARFKIFIIDEIHMLTTQAFNALLKTLEEPPSFVKFILATTDPLKLPATILSRAQHFRFKKIPNKDVVHHLSHILNIEKIDYEPASLEVISRSGQGSLRDTLTLLDQAIIFSKNKITLSSVTDMLGLIDPKFIDRIFDTILANGDILPLIEELEEYETGQICDEISIYLKEKMIQNDRIKFDVVLFDRFFRIIADAKHLLSLNSNNSFVLILMLSKMMEATKLKSIDEVINEIEAQEVASSFEVKKIEQIVEIKENEKEEQIEIKENLNIIQEIKMDDGLEKYKKLISIIGERSSDLSECFEKNFIYKLYENNTLYITSYAQDDDRKFLYKHFALIRSYIDDVYGKNTQLEFEKGEVEQKKNDDIEQENDNLDIDNNNNFLAIGDAISNSYDEIEPPSSCIEEIILPGVQTKQMQVEEILKSNIVEKAKELFRANKIVVRTKI